jgi:hypothetical protein
MKLLKYLFIMLILAMAFTTTESKADDEVTTVKPFTGSFDITGMIKEQHSLRLPAAVYSSVTDTGIMILGDTIKQVSISNAYGIYITLSDSSNSKTDSVIVQIRTGNKKAYWSTLAVHDLSQTTATTNVALIIPGDAVTKTYVYYFDYPFSGDIRLVRLNGVLDAGPYTPRTPFVVTQQQQ